MTFTTSTVEADDRLATTNSDLSSGKIVIYAGPVPANADASLGAATVLATLSFSAAAFSAPSGRSMIANAIGTLAATGTGTATFFRLLKSDGVTVIGQGTVTLTGGGGDMTLSSTTMSSGDLVDITSGTIGE